MITLKLPSEVELAWPTVVALRDLGGSGRNAQITETVAESEGFTEEQLSILDKRKRPYIHYRIAWARTVLKRIGVLENSTRGVWSLTQLGWDLTEDECLDKYQQERLKIRVGGRKATTGKEHWNKTAESNVGSVSLDISHDIDDDVSDDFYDWKSELLEHLTEMPPTAFEKLSRLLLLEAGFQNVQVTGRPGDGGIDGVGVYRVSLVSFPVYFQCKRYSGTVPASAIRDFRGALAGRGEKGLLITTGEFGKGARDEAVRAGATPIDLVDGERLCELLKQYELGVKVATRTVEDVVIVSDFFNRF